jgi:hypothetical protein
VLTIGDVIIAKYKFCKYYTTYCKHLGSQSALRTLVTLDQFVKEPDDDLKESKHVALK